jgi:hypothetical protein
VTITMKRLFVGAAILTAFVATSASAALIIEGTTQAGPFSLANPLAGFTPVDLSNKNTYDWAFSLADPLKGSISTLQVEAQAQHSGDNEVITFDLYSGSPGSGSYLGTSSTGTNANASFSALPGNYYLEVTPTYIKQGSNNEAFSGTLLVSSVPEPAAWALMLVGFGGLGVALRRSASKTLAI